MTFPILSSDIPVNTYLRFLLHSNTTCSTLWTNMHRIFHELWIILEQKSVSRICLISTCNNNLTKDNLKIKQFNIRLASSIYVSRDVLNMLRQSWVLSKLNSSATGSSNISYIPCACKISLDVVSTDITYSAINRWIGEFILLSSSYSPSSPWRGCCLWCSG